MLERIEPRSGAAPKPSTVRLVNGKVGWNSENSQQKIYLDGKKLGVLIGGKAPTNFVVPRGQHRLQLRRGLFAKSNEIVITVRPGQATTVAYEIGAFIFITE